MVLLELDKLVVSTSDGSFVGSLRDENDEEVSNKFSMYRFRVHLLLREHGVGSDETKPGEETIRDRQYPNETPQGTESEYIVSPGSGWVVNYPNSGDSRNEEEMRQPGPRL